MKFKLKLLLVPIVGMFVLSACSQKKAPEVDIKPLTSADADICTSFANNAPFKAFAPTLKEILTKDKNYFDVIKQDQISAWGNAALTFLKAEGVDPKELLNGQVATEDALVNTKPGLRILLNGVETVVKNLRMQFSPTQPNNYFPCKIYVNGK